MFVPTSLLSSLATSTHCIYTPCQISHVSLHMCFPLRLRCVPCYISMSVHPPLICLSMVLPRSHQMSLLASNSEPMSSSVYDLTSIFSAHVFSLAAETPCLPSSMSVNSPLMYLSMVLPRSHQMLLLASNSEQMSSSVYDLNSI